MPETEVVLISSFEDGLSWDEVARVRTGNEGDFSVIFTPSTTGEYTLIASWIGNNVFPASNVTIRLQANMSIGLLVIIVTIVLGVAVIIAYKRKRSRMTMSSKS